MHTPLLLLKNDSHAWWWYNQVFLNCRHHILRLRSISDRCPKQDVLKKAGY